MPSAATACCSASRTSGDALLVVLLLPSPPVTDPEMNRAVRRLAPDVLAAPMLVVDRGIPRPGPATRCPLDGCRCRDVAVAAALRERRAGTCVPATSPSATASSHHRAGRVARGVRSVGRRGTADVHGRGGAASSAWRGRRACGGSTSTSCPTPPSWRSTCATERRRNALARDVYSYLHFTLVLGVVLIALGLKKSLLVWASRSS